MRANERYNENGWLKDEFLWPLRQQIVLDSVFTSDFENNFGIEAKKVQDFFDAYSSFISRLAKEDGIYEDAEKFLATLPDDDCRKRGSYPVEDLVGAWINERYDNEENLKTWYNHYDCESGNPLPLRMVNVDIHYDFARSIRVLAKDEDEAYDIVDEMMRNGEIPLSTFEATGDWELDTSYQPEKE